MAYALLRQGDLQAARQLFEDNIRGTHQASLTIALVFAIEGLVSLHVNQERPARAARLIAWADAMREKIGDRRPPIEQASVERDLALIHSQLEAAMFQAEQEAGRQMTMDEAIEYALSEDVVD